MNHEFVSKVMIDLRLYFGKSNIRLIKEKIEMLNIAEKKELINNITLI